LIADLKGCSHWFCDTPDIVKGEEGASAPSLSPISPSAPLQSSSARLPGTSVSRESEHFRFMPAPFYFANALFADPRRNFYKMVSLQAAKKQG